MGYVWVKDRCTHEDYPCCGCSLEEYLMDERDARELKAKGKLHIIAKYRPDEDLFF